MTPLPAWVKLVREAAALPVVQRITSPADAVKLLRLRADAEEVEVFWVLTLNAQNDVVTIQELTRGIVNSSLVHPREVFRVAVATGASSLVVAHNHPSGNAAPSADDRAVTSQLVAAGRVLDIPVYDHIILGRDPEYFSFAEAGLL